MAGARLYRQVPRQYEDLTTEELRLLGTTVHPLLEKGMRAAIRHRRLIAEGLNAAIDRSAASDAGTEQPSADTAISTNSYVSLTGLSFVLVTPVPCRGVIVAELDFTTTAQGTLWAQIWIGGAPVRTRVSTSVLSLTSGGSASTGSLTLTAPARTFPANSSRTVDVKCRAADSGAFQLLSTSLVSWTTLPIDGGS